MFWNFFPSAVTRSTYYFFSSVSLGWNLKSTLVDLRASSSQFYSLTTYISYGWLVLNRNFAGPFVVFVTMIFYKCY